MQIAIIIGFVRLSLGKTNANADEMLKQAEIERTEIDTLKELAKDEYFYTEDCKFADDITSEEINRDREYRIMEEKYFRMFEMMFRRREPYKYECAEEGKRVIELRYLYNNRPDDKGKAYSFRGRSPGKWLDYVIFYALEKRHAKIEDADIFLGVAIYSEFYKVSGKHRDTLLGNLINLYVRRSILDNPEGFYSSIYTINGNGKDLRDKQELTLLERVMKEVLLRVLEVLGLPFSFEREGNGREDINLTIYEQNPLSLDGFYDKRASVGICGYEVATLFDNVVMERMPVESISDDEKKILLALIGMVRRGKNIVSVRCGYWIKNYDFSRALKLVNTNRNLVGVTELRSDMDLEGMLGGIKGQLEQLEISFGAANMQK